MEELGAGTVCKGIIDCYPVKAEKRKITFDPGSINKLLGTDISDDTMKEIFKRLEIDVDDASAMVTAPTFRPDLECEADLAEEVARFYDYNNIKATLLEGKAATVAADSRTEDRGHHWTHHCSPVVCSEIIHLTPSPARRCFDMINAPRQ